MPFCMDAPAGTLPTLGPPGSCQYRPRQAPLGLQVGLTAVPPSGSACAQGSPWAGHCHAEGTATCAHRELARGHRRPVLSHHACPLSRRADSTVQSSECSGVLSLGSCGRAWRELGEAQGLHLAGEAAAGSVQNAHCSGPAEATPTSAGTQGMGTGDLPWLAQCHAQAPVGWSRLRTTAEPLASLVRHRGT